MSSSLFRCSVRVGCNLVKHKSSSLFAAASKNSKPLISISHSHQTFRGVCSSSIRRPIDLKNLHRLDASRGMANHRYVLFVCIVNSFNSNYEPSYYQPRRHKKIIKLAKGYRGRTNCFTIARPRVMKARQYAYRDRKVIHHLLCYDS